MTSDFIRLIKLFLINSGNLKRDRNSSGVLESSLSPSTTVLSKIHPPRLQHQYAKSQVWLAIPSSWTYRDKAVLLMPSKKRGEAELQLYPYSTLALDGGDWSAPRPADLPPGVA